LQAGFSTTSASKQLQMKRQAMEFRITLMTIVIVVIFMVCNSFESLLFILHSHDLLNRNIVEDYLRPICDALMIFNSSVNVLIYGAVSSQFRAAFCEMFSCLQTEKKSTGSKTNSSNIIPSSALLSRKTTINMTKKSSEKV
jgi:hypothetical protein